MRYLLAIFVIAVAAIAAVKALSIPAADKAQARAAAVQTDASPAIDPATLMRTAPLDLPVEMWNAI